MFYALIWINNHVFSCLISMLSVISTLMMMRMGGGQEDRNTISKLRNENNLTDPYKISEEKNPKKGVDDDLEGEKA